MFFLSPKKKAAQKQIREEASLYLDTLYQTALRLTKNASDAQDLVQDTYSRAFRFEDKFEPGTHLKAWLFKVMYHIFVNQYRRKIRERDYIHYAEKNVYQDSLLSDSHISHTTYPENNYLDQIVSSEVTNALERLSEEYRTVVLLCDINEFSYKEVADILDVPVGTVMSRLFRGRQILKKDLYHHAVSQGIIKNDPNNVSHLDEYRQKKAGTR